MQNKFKLGIGTIVIIALVMFGMGQTSKPTTPTIKCFISNDMNIIKVAIESWSKYGYSIKSITPQSISTSINTHPSSGGHTEPSHRTEKGDILLVMEK